MYRPPGGVVLRPQKIQTRKYTRAPQPSYRGPPPGLILPKFVLGIFLAIGLTALGVGLYLINESRIELGRIECNVKDMIAGREYRVNVTCYDNKDRPLKDVRVHIEGASIDETKISDENGRVEFNVTPLLPMNVHNDIVQITAFHPSNPEIVRRIAITVHD